MKIFFIISLLFVHLYAYFDMEPLCCQQEIIDLRSDGSALKNPSNVDNYYQKNGQQLQWDAKDLHDFITLTRDPMFNYLFLDYHQDEIERLMLSLESFDLVEQKRVRAQIELLATDGFFSFAKDLSIGMIDWDQFSALLIEGDIDLVWEKNPKVYHYDTDLTTALHTDMLAVLLHRYIPNEDGYRALVKAYHDFPTKALPIVDYGKEMKLGDYGYRASQLKAFLAASGDLEQVDKNYIEFPTFDERLEFALKRFQKRHYLKESGILDRVTVLYTRKNIEKQRALIKLNIERYKLFPRIYDKEFIIINIPEFSLKYYQYATLIKDMFVVIGREDRPTPIFSDMLEYIVLNPAWIVPQNLMRKDYIPKLLADPSSLVDQDIHIHQQPSRYAKEINPANVNWEQYLDENRHIPYYFIQYPGEKNVLGEMKFIFPNRYKVYLHDTNAKALTTQKYRLYSSGCVRLAKPYALLNLLSAHTAYAQQELIERIESKKTINIPLKTKIPIHIRYQTVFVNSDHELSFRRDFYGIDVLQQKAMHQH